MNINLNISHPSAFISSTFADLKDERYVVSEALRKRGIIVNALDVQPASNHNSRKAILNGIKESDFIILILGERYGSFVSKLTMSTNLSVTHWEYVMAVKSGKSVLAFIKTGASVGTDDGLVSDADHKIKQRKLAIFKGLVVEKHNPAYFESSAELAIKVESALVSVYRAGVADLLRKVNSLESSLQRAESDNKILADQVAASKVTSKLRGSTLSMSDPLSSLRSGGLLSQVTHEPESLGRPSSLRGLMDVHNLDKGK